MSPSESPAISGAPTAVPSGQVPFDARWLVAGTDTMVMTRTGDAQPVAAFSTPGRVVVGMTIESVRRARDVSGRRVWEVAFEQRDALAVVAQTTTDVDATSLAPVRQRATLDDGRIVTLIYAVGHIAGIDSVPGYPVRYFDAAVPATAFTSGAIDLMLRALPLADGYRTMIPVYFPADQLVHALPVRVGGREQITTRSGRVVSCWLVAIEFPDDVTEHFWIEERTHALVRILAHAGPTSLVRYDR